MERLCVEGGRILSGEVVISGAKNATLPIMCAALLSAGPVRLSNIPHLRDVDTTVKLLSCLGAKVEWLSGDEIMIDASVLTSTEAPYELVKTMRASILVLGPLLSRCGSAKVSLPGGCSIGARPVDQHLKAIRFLGVDIELVDGYVVAKAKQQKLSGADIYFDVVTVTGTENAIMAAVLAQGVTVIHNAACEPEVTDLIHFLCSLGAIITGAGTSVIKVQGVGSLRGSRDRYHVMPDRIEAGTYLAAGAITGGRVQLLGVRASDMESTLDKFREMGARLEVASGGDSIMLDSRNLTLHAIPQIVTAPYPGFPTDMQAQLMALACVVEGDSYIIENIFENRFMHVAELNRMGANIEMRGNQAIVHGGQRFSGAQVMATDLRASASLVLAALAADGVTTIDRVYHLDRGYERLAEKMSGLGAKMWRTNHDNES